MMKELNLKEIQRVSLNILLDVDRFCRQNKIKYSLAYGTLLGAVRHKGFIPWDDDIDIIMPREDYERFIDSYKENKYYELISYRNKSCYISYARVCDKTETTVVTSNPWCKKQTGIWIDIFPVDGVSKHYDRFIKQYQKAEELRIHTLKQRTCCLHFNLSRGFLFNLKLFVKKIIWLNGYSIRRTIYKLNKLVSRKVLNNSNYWSQLVCIDGSGVEYHSIKDFEKCIPIVFENHKLLALNGYHRVLTSIYGNYLELPPLEDRLPKQSYMKIYWK